LWIAPHHEQQRACVLDSQLGQSDERRPSLGSLTSSLL
jgi:hypothetical protein